MCVRHTPSRLRSPSIARIRVSDELPHLGDLRLLGITGAPGSGKSTFAAAVAAAYDGVVVPMDGFHLPNTELERLGLRDRKGAPETFDAKGYAALLERIASGEAVLAPMFERTTKEPTADPISVPGSGLVVTEGNYLLLDEPRWRAVRDSLDAVWHVQVDEKVRLERLVARHVVFGKLPREARAWVARVDQPNAVLVDAAADRADLVLDLSDWEL